MYVCMHLNYLFFATGLTKCSNLTKLYANARSNIRPGDLFSEFIWKTF